MPEIDLFLFLYLRLPRSLRMRQDLLALTYEY